MAITTAEELAQQALNHNLLDERQMQQVWGEFGSKNVSLEQLRKVLLSRDLLTFYQIEHLIAGDRTSFYYGDYKVLYLVGTGTFARVYRSTNPKTNEQVAVKVLRKRFSDIRVEAQRFHQEGQIGMSLKHPNIVPIYDAVSNKSVHYIVIEFVEGQNLLQFIKVRKKFEPFEATKLIHDVCKGLDYAFKKGIYHRDMKMSNVLVSSRGQARLVDFGLASADGSMSDEILVKNPNPRAIDYAGLERSTGVHKDDPRSDIFFVGCMYYQMLSGKPALSETRDRTKRLSRSRFQDIESISRANPEVPVPMATIVNKAISFDPDKRYQSPGEMAADLNRLLKEQKEAKLKADQQAAGIASGMSSEANEKREGYDAQGNPRTVMIVEGDPTYQDLFRDRLKRNGYRVLVVSDTERALSRFEMEPSVADLIVLSTLELGESALETFNKFARQESTKDLPAILLLGDRHHGWEDQALTAEHRLVAKMPITFRQLRELLVTALERL